MNNKIFVKQLAEQVYMLNDSVILFNFNQTDDEVTYDIDYNSDKFTQQEAEDLAAQFINEVIEYSLHENLN